MNKQKRPLFFYSIFASCSLASIGICVAERSIIGVIICIVLFVTFMGLGFTKKKKLRERGLL